MRRGRFFRLCLVLGAVAMFGATIELPVAATTAVAKTMSAAKASTAAPDQKTSHKSAKPCSHCPNKAGFDMGSCLVKCFQAFYSPAAKFVLLGFVVTSRGPPPALSLPAVGTSVPPSLRPPSA